MYKRFLRIRLSILAVFYLITFVIVLKFLKQQTLSAGQLALFSVNTFLFGYYFAPLLQAQKSRVANLNETTRKEAMTLLDILTQSHLLKPANRHELKVKLRVYLQSIIGNPNVAADNKYYDELLYWTKRIKGDDQQVLDEIYGRVSATQENRDELANLFASKVYSHEWLVAWVLFGITLYFALQTHYDSSIFFGLMLAILCTGLCMLMTIMLKFATLTHKEAKRMWDPLKELDAKHFDDITTQEMEVETARLHETT